MKPQFIAALGCLSCWCSVIFLPSTLASPSTPPPPNAARSALEDGGSKLASDDTQGAIRSLRDAMRAEPTNPVACRLLSIAYLHARQHNQTAEAAENALKLPSLTPSQRAVASLLLGRARYNALLDEYEKGTSQYGSLPNMA